MVRCGLHKMLLRLALLSSALFMPVPSLAGAPTAAVVQLETAELLSPIGADPQQSRHIQLPLHWDAMFRKQSGTAEVRLRFTMHPDDLRSTEPWLLFATRIANAYSLELNGADLGSVGSIEAQGAANSSKRPVAITFPARLLKDQNELTIRIRADARRRAGISPILIGPVDALQPIAAREARLRVTLPILAAGFSLLVSAFGLLLWLQQREPLYAWAFAGEAIWALVVADTILEQAPLNWLPWSALLFVLRAVWMWALYAIIEQVCGARPPRERLMMQVLVLGAASSAVLSLAVSSLQPMLVMRLVLAAAWLMVIVRLLLSLRRSSGSEAILLILAVALLFAAGVRDSIVVAASSGVAELAWAKYVGTLLGLTIMWVVSRRFLLARLQAQRLQETLAQRVEEKEQELRQSFERLSQVEAARAVTAERERILRDMHDGVGATLATAMRQLESGAAQPGDVVATLRESMDQLKLSIDAMTLPPGDVNALLASLRYRLQPRITGAGLAVQWDVEALPPWREGTAQRMRHLQFILLEAISNVLQHANASTISLGARALADALEICIRDDGTGVSAAAASRGLQSMRARAGRIGAQLCIEALDPGTCIRLVVDNRAEGSAGR